MPDGSVWFESNRDQWRDSGGANQGAALILRWDPSSPTAFTALASYTGPKPWALSRDGTRYSVASGNTVQVFDDSDALVATSDFDFNSANVAGFMRFVP